MLEHRECQAAVLATLPRFQKLLTKLLGHFLTRIVMEAFWLICKIV